MTGLNLDINNIVAGAAAGAIAGALMGKGAKEGAMLGAAITVLKPIVQGFTGQLMGPPAAGNTQTPPKAA